MRDVAVVWQFVGSDDELPAVPIGGVGQRLLPARRRGRNVAPLCRPESGRSAVVSAPVAGADMTPRFRVPRVRLLRPLTGAEWAYVAMLAHRHNAHDIGERLGITVHTVRFHLRGAALKMPGDLPAQMRCDSWFRGAPLEVLTGSWMRAEEAGRASG